MSRYKFSDNSIDYINIYIKHYEELMETDEFKQLVKAEDLLIVTSAYKKYIYTKFEVLLKSGELDIEKIMGDKEKHRLRYHQISPWSGGIIRNHMMLIEDREMKMQGSQ